MSTELALVPPKETALQVFQAENGLDPYLQQIRAEIDAFVPDVSTKKGRDAIASIAHKVARSKTALDNVGKELVAELKEIPKKIDAERKRMRDTLDAWKDEVRAPLNEWEAAEEARKAKHQGAIDQINMRLECRDLDSSELCQNIEWLETMAIDEGWEEFESEALRAKDKALAALREALVARERHEAEQAELERLRAEAAQREQKEREERIAREAAEQAQREAEQRAQAERDAAARREAEAKAAAEQRELQLKLEAEQSARRELEAQQRAEQAERDAEAKAQAAAAAERQRQADEQASIEREAKAREADIAHKTAVLTSIKESFMGAGITEEQAKAIINMIRKGEVPSVSITY
ncbi:IgA-specific serine endopeptidase autotransporter precursor [Pseudomonas sp. BAY1663]|uniref:phage protein n=1 Tax=Pseudomonas sp. BAY1663 TaxID=1439940 RepID=UPI00042DFB1C|nr:phage protein [Pseudomonas sp. BAY1663]EXF45221.1 IgA-specific serine endopeptidase autotransporter precursor [Pseudomonas sp. BAY1663]